MQKIYQFTDLNLKNYFKSQKIRYKTKIFWYKITAKITAQFAQFYAHIYAKYCAISAIRTI